MRKKRFISLALALAMLLSLCPVTVFATDSIPAELQGTFEAPVSVRRPNEDYTGEEEYTGTVVLTITGNSCSYSVTTERSEVLSATDLPFLSVFGDEYFFADDEGDYDVSIYTSGAFMGHDWFGTEITFQGSFTPHTFTGDYVTDDAHPGQHGQKCVNDGCGEVGNWTDHVYTDSVCVCGAVDGWLWENTCDMVLGLGILGIENFMDYNNAYVLLKDDFELWQATDNTLNSLAAKSFISAVCAKNETEGAEGDMLATWSKGTTMAGEFTRLPPMNSEGKFILPAAFSGDCDVVAVLSNGTEYYYEEEHIFHSTLMDALSYPTLSVTTLTYANEVKPMHFGPHAYTASYNVDEANHPGQHQGVCSCGEVGDWTDHSFTGEYYTAGGRKGQHAQKCECGAVGNWTDHVYTDGKCVCGEAEPLDASDFAALIGESFTSPEFGHGGAYVCHVVFEESGVRFYEERTSDHLVMAEFTASYGDIGKTEEGWRGSCEVSNRVAYLDGSFTEGPTCAHLHLGHESLFNEFTHVHHYDKYSVNEAEHPGKHQEICGFCDAPGQWVDHEFKDDRCVCGAWATHVHEGISFAPISSFEELRQLCDYTGGAGYLTADITLDEGSSLTVDQTVQLDLNGKVLNLNGKNITVSSNGVLEVYDCKSETVHTFGDDDGLWLWDDTLTGNAVKHSVTGGLITGGRARQGGGLSINGSVTINRGSICGNKATSNGGGVYVTANGSLTINRGSICGNFASAFGGGLFVDGGTVSLLNTRIEENAANFGAGIFINAGSVTAEYSVITGNVAVNGGGGVEIENAGSKLTLINSSVIENSVKNTDNGLHKGAGIHFNKGTLDLCGRVRIRDNTCLADGKESNLYLRNNEDRFLYVVSPDNQSATLSPMSSASDIGVFAEQAEKQAIDSPISVTSTKDVVLLLTCFRVDNIPSGRTYSLRTDGEGAVELYPHEHHYTYAAPTPSAEAFYLLTATCDQEGCATPYAVLTLTPNGLGEESVRSWVNVCGEEPTVVFYEVSDPEHENPLKSMPLRDGSYIVRATVDGVTQSLPFEIINDRSQAMAAYNTYRESVIDSFTAMVQEDDSEELKAILREASGLIRSRFYDTQTTYADNVLWIDLAVMATEEKVAAQRLSEAKDAATDEILDASGFPDCSDEVEAIANKAMEDILTAETVEEVNAILEKALADIAAQKEIEAFALIVGNKSEIFGATSPVDETEEDEIVNELTEGYDHCDNDANDQTLALVTELKKVEADESGKVSSITYDVTPKDGEGKEVHEPDKPITFELPVTEGDFKDDSYVKVEHKSGVEDQPDEEYYAKTSTKRGDSWLVRVVKTVLSYFSEVKLTVADGFNPVARIGKDDTARYFDTLEAAVKQAKPGDTITLLEDCEGNGILIDKPLTIDFDNHTYTISGEAIGGTETSMNQGFHIEYANHSIEPGVTLKNGTLALPASNLTKTVEEKPVTRMLQNYVNLTMENMVITDENVQLRSKGVHNPVEDQPGYVSLARDTLVECDSGNSVFTNCTITATHDNRYALALDDRQGMCPTGTHIKVVGGSIGGNIRFYEEDNKPGQELISTLTFDDYTPALLDGTIVDETDSERDPGDKVDVVVHAAEGADEQFVTVETTDEDGNVIVEILNNVVSYAATLTLNENINLNFYVGIPEGNKDWHYESFAIRSTFLGKTVVQSPVYAYSENGIDYYKAVVAMTKSYQMNENVAIEVLYGESALGSVNYSVRQYLETESQNTKNTQALRNLCLATLSYGGSAQRFFGGTSYKDGTYPVYTGDELVDSKYHYDLSGVTEPTNQAALTTAISGISNYSASLVLGNEVSLKIYFSTKNAAGIGVGVQCSGKDWTHTEPVQEGKNLYSFKVTHLRSVDLNKDYTITITQNGKQDTITYSPYVFLKQNWSDASLGELCKAIKAYGDCANTAFKK